MIVRLLAVTLTLALATAVQAAPSDPAKPRTFRVAPKALAAKPPKAAPPMARAAPQPVPQDDQSYLFATDPRSGKGPPDYVTSGSKHSNQPWFMTIYDTVGGWN